MPRTPGADWDDEYVFTSPCHPHAKAQVSDVRAGDGTHQFTCSEGHEITATDPAWIDCQRALQWAVVNGLGEMAEREAHPDDDDRTAGSGLYDFDARSQPGGGTN